MVFLSHSSQVKWVRRRPCLISKSANHDDIRDVVWCITDDNDWAACSTMLLSACIDWSSQMMSGNHNVQSDINGVMKISQTHRHRQIHAGWGGTSNYWFLHPKFLLDQIFPLYTIGPSGPHPTRPLNTFLDTPPLWIMCRCGPVSRARPLLIEAMPMANSEFCCP